MAEGHTFVPGANNSSDTIRLRVYVGKLFDYIGGSRVVGVRN